MDFFSMYQNQVYFHDKPIADMFSRHLFHRAMSVFKWQLPKTWNKDFFLYVLFSLGYIAVFETDRYGVIPMFCSLEGLNLYYQPRYCRITNPLIAAGSSRAEIDKNCVLLKLGPDYRGILETVRFYGEMMALCAQTAGVNTLNSSVSYIFGCQNKNIAESLKRMFEQILERKPGVFVDSALLKKDGTPNWQTFQQNVKENYISDKLLDDLQRWQNLFDTEIGIPNSSRTKKERMISDEVNSNNIETQTKADLWLENLQEGCEKVNQMFRDVNISVDWRYEEQEAGGVAV